jgi:hypothetical protein
MTYRPESTPPQSSHSTSKFFLRLIIKQLSDFKACFISSPSRLSATLPSGKGTLVSKGLHPVHSFERGGLPIYRTYSNRTLMPNRNAERPPAIAAPPSLIYLHRLPGRRTHIGFVSRLSWEPEPSRDPRLFNIRRPWPYPGNGFVSHFSSTPPRAPQPAPFQPPNQHHPPKMGSFRTSLTAQRAPQPDSFHCVGGRPPREMGSFRIFHRRPTGRHSPPSRFEMGSFRAFRPHLPPRPKLAPFRIFESARPRPPRPRLPRTLSRPPHIH